MPVLLDWSAVVVAANTSAAAFGSATAFDDGGEEHAPTSTRTAPTIPPPIASGLTFIESPPLYSVIANRPDAFQTIVKVPPVTELDPPK